MCLLLCVKNRYFGVILVLSKLFFNLDIMKVKLFLSIILTSLIMVSCQNDLLSEVQTDVDLQTKSLDSKVGARCFVNDEGALVFETLEDYNILIDSISKLSETEFLEWEKEIGFESYRTYTNRLMDELDNSTEFQMTKKLDANYQNYLLVKEEGLLLPKIPSQIYASICNREGYFYVGEIKNIVDGEFFYAEGDNLNPDLNKRMTYSIGGEQYGNAIEYPALHSTPHGDYKVMTWFRIFRTRAVSSSGTSYNTALEISVRPRSWGKIVGWKDRESVCYIEEVKLHMKGLGNTYIAFDEDGNSRFTKDEYIEMRTIASSKATKRYTWTVFMNFPIFVSDPGMLYDPYCVHYRARANVVGKYGVAYNTYHPEPGMADECKHRLVTDYQNVDYGTF